MEVSLSFDVGVYQHAYPFEDWWIAECREYDIITQGATEQEAVTRLQRTIAATILVLLQEYKSRPKQIPIGNDKR